MKNPLKAYENIDFLKSDYCREIRLQLEYLHPEVEIREQGIKSTVVMFGSARIPSAEDAKECKNDGLAAMASYYEEARKLSQKISEVCKASGETEFVVVTGGGGGIMEAGNRGASDKACKSIALNIKLPFEQQPNPYVTPDLCFLFHYFHMRKMHFLQRAKIVCVFPGGFGTFDELFETLTLIQTGVVDPVPVILFGTEHWKRLIDWEYLAECGMINKKDLDLFSFCDNAEEGWEIIKPIINGENV